MALDSMQVVFKGLEPYSLSGVTVTDEKLGTGSYATVFKLDYLGLKCAGKKIHELLLGQGSDRVTYTVQRFKDECQILSHVRHPNVVQFLGVFFQQGVHIPILVMEFLPLNLYQCLDKHNLPDETRYSILHDVALGLHYLHSQSSPIVHRDLSSNNVLLTSDMIAKISDLGVARILNLSPQQVTHLTKAPGTPAFMPPEVMIAKPSYDTSVDIFSYGILMIHVLSGKWPEPQIGPNRTEGSHLIPVSEAERRGPFLEAIGGDHPLMDIILKCIYNNPEMRAQTSEIVDRLTDMVEQHPISFKNQLDMMEYIRRLEGKNAALERENCECKSSQMLDQAKKTKETILRLEREQEEHKTEVQTLLHTMEKAIDNLKTSLTDEVKRVLNHGAQSTSSDLDELRQELKQIEAHTFGSKAQASHEKRSYENVLPIYRGKSDTTKSEHVHTVIKQNSKIEARKQEVVFQSNENLETDPPPHWLKSQPTNKNSDTDRNKKDAQESSISVTEKSSLKSTETTEHTMESPLQLHKRTHMRSSSSSTTKEIADVMKHDQHSRSRPKSVSVDNCSNAHQHIPVLQRSKGKVNKQPKVEIMATGMIPSGAEVNRPLKVGMASQITIKSERSAATNVSVSKHPPKGGSKPPPPIVPNKPQRGQGPPPTLQGTKEENLKKNEHKEDAKLRGFTVSESVTPEKEEDHVKKNEGRKRSTSESTATKVDPEKKTPEKKKKVSKFKGIFSSKLKEDKSKPSLEQSSTHEFESSASVYDISPQTTSSQTKATDDLAYPVYTAMFDYEATSPSELSFKKGDQMYIKSKGGGKMWHARLTVGTVKEGNIPKSYVTALEDEEWFAGKMDSTTARNFVMTSSNQLGSFLVRQNKESGIFSLTVRDRDKPRQYHILKQENGMLFASHQCSFRSIYDLVQHHSKNADGLFTALAKPCIAPLCITDQAEVICKEKVATVQFSEVWKGEWKGVTVMVNKVKQGAMTNLDLLDKCAFMKTINHENLIQFYAMYMNSEPFLVVTEYMANGSLKEYLPSEGKGLKMAELIKISEQVAAAMAYLEEQNCIHQDLEAKNIMLEVRDEESLSIVCKLSIYPYVHKVSEYGAFYSLPSGTIPIRWSSHKAIVNNQINIKSNVWSFGIFVWEIVHHCQSYPYPETSDAGVLDKIKQGYRMPRPLGCPEELYELMTDCWKEDASCRPTFETLHWRLRDFYSSDSFGYAQPELLP